MGLTGLPMMVWVLAALFLVVLIDYSTSSVQEVHMAHLTNTRGFSFSIFRVIGSVLTNIVGSAPLI